MSRMARPTRTCPTGDRPPKPVDDAWQDRAEAAQLVTKDLITELVAMVPQDAPFDAKVTELGLPCPAGNQARQAWLLASSRICLISS